MQTRAKFKCHAVTQSDWGNGVFVFAAEFSAVCGDSEENKKFFAATPSGNIKIQTMRDNYFEPGKEYYVDFTPCE